MPIRVLISNRGEIAIRVARSVSELGYTPLGVYTSVDKNSLHRRFVIEDSEVSSYLDMDDIIEAAIQLGADAVHPGYGFLSENSEFARRVIAKGLVWIGPRPEVIDRAGDKLGLKEIVLKLGLPTLPYQRVEDPEDVLEFARDYGYPVLLKAAGGGGGIGMRVVRSEREAESKVSESVMEAERAFKDRRIYVEPFIEMGKHIEVQIIGDGDNVVHLYERECSVQFRYQKIVEEAPSPSITPETRRALTDVAVELMKSMRYDNAGTVEFIYDVKTGKFYVMEVNARIQVEHPVTEMITGIDIVKRQIKVAFEGSLDLRQNEVAYRGHAIEARIEAQNPLDLSPSTGYITRYIEPAGPGVRVDSGVTAGSYVPIDYNPLISKVIAYGRDRNEAVSRLLRSLNEYVVEGIQTNIPFVKAIINSPSFRDATYTTTYVEQSLGDLFKQVEKEVATQALATAVVAVVKPEFSKTLKGKLVKEKLPESRVESIKRRAWTYWTLTRSRLRRK
ncbi:acetyl-CoA carboxylase biotin carboxylase subunit [Thermogladius calderae]|nr:biotin carboxylase N-terminal domain-containing protein [Thermogladius calderae]